MTGGRRCFLHIGLHKTGTTSIQDALSRGTARLAEQGLLYPVSGRLVEISGQHNLAWEITRDHRHVPSFGTIHDLIAEIAGQPHDVILSSEDFEGVVAHAHEFRTFLGQLDRAGLSCTAIMYVRDQVEALPRGYLMLVLLGLDQPFSDFLASSLDSGRYQWREWVLNFDYAGLASWLGSFGIDVQVRSYEAARPTVCSDFLSLFGSRVSDLGLESEPEHNATSPLPRYLLAYWENRLGTRIDAAFAGQLPGMGQGVASHAISPAARQEIKARFADSNRELAHDHGVVFGTAEQSAQSGQPGTIYLDRLFGA